MENSSFFCSKHGDFVPFPLSPPQKKNLAGFAAPPPPLFGAKWQNFTKNVFWPQYDLRG